MSNLVNDVFQFQQVDNEKVNLNEVSQDSLSKSNSSSNFQLNNHIGSNKVNNQNIKSKCKSQTQRRRHHHHHHHHLTQSSNENNLNETINQEQNKLENSFKQSSDILMKKLESMVISIDNSLTNIKDTNKVNENINSDHDLSNINLGYQSGSLISLCNTQNQPNNTNANNLAGVTHTITLSKSNGHYPNHCHTDDFIESIDKTARKKLIIASILCLLFMIGETVGGIVSNSLAIATDAAHLLTDFASFMISLFSIWLASRPVSKQMSFGYYRAEVIGALTSVILIWVVTGILVMVAIQRLATNTFDLDVHVMLITAAIGVVVNIIMGLALQIGGVPHGHHGHHGHHHNEELGHSHEIHVSNLSHENLNVRAAFIHVLGDFIQSLGVMIAAIVIYFYPNLQFIDPICTFFFSILVLFTTFHIIRDVINVLMEGIPKGIDFFEVQKTLLNIPGVIKVHNLRVWSLSLDKIALSAHLAIGKNQDAKSILLKASKLKDKFKIFDLTIQVEEYKEEMKDCNQCNRPNSIHENTRLLQK